MARAERRARRRVWLGRILVVMVVVVMMMMMMMMGCLFSFDGW